jgi:hypothetical protein
VGVPAPQAAAHSNNTDAILNHLLGTFNECNAKPSSAQVFFSKRLITFNIREDTEKNSD